MTRPLCLTADDFGLRRENNAAIVELALGGHVDAVSVMAHDGAQLDGLDELRRSQAALGLHVVLVGERPLCGAALGPFVDAGGLLPASWGHLFARMARYPLEIARLGREIEAQVARYLALGLPLDFINSHQHIHMFPLLWGHVLSALAPFPRAAVRASRAAPFGLDKDGALALASRVSWGASPARDREILSPRGVAFSGRTTLAAIDGALRRPGRAGEVCELLFHPGASEETAAPRHGAWGYRWSDEARLLRSGALAELIAWRGYVRTVPGR